MPRTIPPNKPLIGIHPTINCGFCANMGKGVDVKDSDLLFATSCPGFKLESYLHCREMEHRLHWKVCAWRHFTNAHSCCITCSIGEGMVDMAHTVGHELPEDK